MNSAEIYSQITGKIEREFLEAEKTSKEPSAQDVARAQLKISWLQATITKEMFADIVKTIQDLEDESMHLVCSMSQVIQGFDKATKLLLIQHNIAILRQIIKTYAQS